MVAARRWYRREQDAVDGGRPSDAEARPSLSDARERPVAGRHAVDDICQGRKIQHDHHEEHDPKRGLDALVAQQPLREPCAGPAAKQFERMQGGFRRAPRTAFGGALVHRVGDKRDEAHDEIRRGYQRPWMSRIPGDDAVHGFTFPPVFVAKMKSVKDCRNMAGRSISNRRSAGKRSFRRATGGTPVVPVGGCCSWLRAEDPTTFLGRSFVMEPQLRLECIKTAFNTIRTYTKFFR